MFAYLPVTAVDQDDFHTCPEISVSLPHNTQGVQVTEKYFGHNRPQYQPVCCFVCSVWASKSKTKNHTKPKIGANVPRRANFQLTKSQKSGL